LLRCEANREVKVESWGWGSLGREMEKPVLRGDSRASRAANMVLKIAPILCSSNVAFLLGSKAFNRTL
jgi:hypothetical protein